MANISYGVNIVPKTNNAYTLGNSDYKWSNIYTVQLNGKNIQNQIKTISTPAQVMSFNDGADNLPVKELQIAVNPVQDLHGYANPWVGGVGKNLFDAEHPNTTSSSGVNYVYNSDGSITLSGTANSNATLFFFVLPNMIPSGSTVSFSLNNSTTNSELGIRLVKRENGTITQQGNNPIYADAVNKTYTYNGTGYDANEINLFVKTNHGAVPEITLKIQCEIGSDATDWTPYTNICPISGCTGVDITQTGKNLIDNSKYVSNKGIAADGTITDANNARLYDMIPIQNGQCVVSTIRLGTSTDNCIRVGIYDENKDFIERKLSLSVSENQTAKVVINNSSVKYIRVCIFTDTESPDYLQVENGTENTPYEPFGNTYSITFPVLAGTVYGGTVTINEDGSGKLIVDRKKVNISDLNWSYATSSKYFWTSIPEIKRGVSNVVTEKLTSDSYVADIPNYVAGSSGTNGTMSVGVSNPYLMIKDYRFTDSTTFKQNNEASIVYELATATEYTLTAQQIRSLLGENNIWADTGNINEITYYVDDTFNFISVEDKAKLDRITAGAAVADVQINGNSILNNGVANIPMAATYQNATRPGNPGIVLPSSWYGTKIQDNVLAISGATVSDVKTGTTTLRPLTPALEDSIAFYGLAKAASDTTQKASSNAVGIYTDEAKIAIQKMLGVYQQPWEFIREDTFTNETEADHTITLDANNEAFDLTDLIFMFETPVQETEAKKGAYGQIKFFYDSKNYTASESGAWTQTANTNAHGFVVRIDQEPGGLIWCRETAQTTSTNSAAWRTRYYSTFKTGSQGIRFLTYVRHFSKIIITSITGTGHYILYGKRAIT